MSLRLATIILSAAITSGCVATLKTTVDQIAESDPASGSQKKETESLALLDRSDTPKTQWDPALLKQARTVYVPSVFSATSKGQLYIGGKLVLFNNTPQADVLGFIPSSKKNSYLVAVSSPRKLVRVDNSAVSNSVLDPEVLKRLSPQDQLRMMEAAAALQNSKSSVAAVANTQSVSTSGFYIAVFEVNSTGEVLRELTGFETSNPKALIGKDGIYFPTPVPGRTGMFNYQGYNSKGSAVQGPSNVSWASPSATAGKWYFFRPDPTDNQNALSTHKIVQWGEWTRSQGYEVESALRIRLQSYMQFLSTTGVFVDEPPLADTARTGAATYVFAEGNSEAIKFQFIDAFIHVYQFGAEEIKKDQIDCFGLCNKEITLASHRFIKAASSDQWSALQAGSTAEFFAKRGFLTGQGESLLYFNQMETGAFGSLVFAGMPTIHKEKPEVVLDVINGVGLNNARKFLFAAAGNKEAFSKNKNAFGVPIFTPAGENPLIIMHSRLDKEVIGINLNSGQIIVDAGYSGTASQFGISLN